MIDQTQSQVVEQVAKMVQNVEQQLAAPTLIINQLEHLHRKTDKILDTHMDMIRLQSQHTEQLAEHMRRTRLVEEQLAPVKKHVAQMDGALKLLGVLSLLAGLVATAAKLFLG